MTEASSRVCANIFLSLNGGGCPAYTETELQARGNVGVEVGVKLGMVPRSRLGTRQGTCEVTGAIVVKENPCIVDRKLFMGWFNSQ